MPRTLTATITVSFDVPDSIESVPKLAEDDSYVLDLAAEAVYAALPDDLPDFDYEAGGVGGSVKLALS